MVTPGLSSVGAIDGHAHELAPLRDLLQHLPAPKCPTRDQADQCDWTPHAAPRSVSRILHHFSMFFYIFLIAPLKRLASYGSVHQDLVLEAAFLEGRKAPKPLGELDSSMECLYFVQ